MTLPELFQSLSQNPVFGGMMGGSAILTVLYALKSVPDRLATVLQWRFTVELVVHSEDDAFALVESWLAGLDYAKRARRLRLTYFFPSAKRRRDGEDVIGKFLVVPGDGRHLVFIGSRPVLLTRQTPERAITGIGRSDKRLENISLRSFGGSPDFLREFVVGLVKAYEQLTADRVRVYTQQYDDWSLSGMKDKRALDSVVMAPALRTGIVEAVDRFVTHRDWYASLGIPYRFGVLLAGPPGTGKTSLALALASHTSRPIYALNLGGVAYDSTLISMISQVPENAILLIEDIDAATISRAPAERRARGEQPDDTTAVKDNRQLVSLSALLNSIDGMFARDGRILILTTNHPEKIDPALIRAGRVDIRVMLDKLGPAEVLQMCQRFLGETSAAVDFAATVQGPIAAAELQERLIAEVTGGARAT